MCGSSSVYGSRVAAALLALKGHYSGFRLESELWELEGPRRSPYRALVLFGLSPRTKDGLLVAMCRRFFSRFPSHQDLARCSDVLKADGSKYEFRGVVRPRLFPFVRSLAQVLAEHGRVPRTSEELLRINGVGEKISECVLAYGWGEEALPADANVRRVVDRIVGASQPAGPKDADSLRRRLKNVYHERRSVFSEAAVAMVDVHEILRLHGQVLCNRKPACAACPVAGCASRRVPMARAHLGAGPVGMWRPWRELLLEPAVAAIPAAAE